MRPPARPTGVLGLAQLAGVTAWSRCRSGECVACWQEQRTANLTGDRPPRRRPARWSGYYQGRPVGLCAQHRAQLSTQAQPAGGAGRCCRIDGAGVRLCARHAAVLLDTSAGGGW